MRFLSFLFAATLAVGGETVSNRIASPADDPPNSSPVAKIVKEDGPPFRLDPDKPWKIHLARGGFGDGYTWIVVDQNGKVDLSRPIESKANKLPEYYETAKVVLPPAAVAKV